MPALADARAHLARAESAPLDESSLYHVDEGLFLLEAAAADGDAAAKTLGTTYTGSMLAVVRGALDDAGLPETVLRVMLKLVQTLEASGFADPDVIGTTRVMVAERLLDRYFEGYSPPERQAFIDALPRG